MPTRPIVSLCRARAAAAAALTLSLAFGPAGCGGRSFSTSDREAIEDLMEAQRAAWNRGDLDAFMSAYWKDVSMSFASGGEVHRGWERTMERYRKRYPDPATMGALEFLIQEVRPLSADTALVLGGFALTETPRAGSGVFTLIVQRRPEGWRIVHDHTSAAASPTAASTAEPSPSPSPAVPSAPPAQPPRGDL